MASKYWLKLYHEILDDPKMGMMSDRLWRRTIEVFLLAGEKDDDGFLPSLDDMAWRLRLTAEELESDLVELAKCNIVSQTEGTWFVTRFKERQEPISSTERSKRYRERKRKGELFSIPNENETDAQRNRNESLQNSARDTDKITDKDIDTDNKQIKDSVVVALSELNINIKKIRELIDNHDPYYLKEKVREYRFQLKQVPSTTPGWLIKSIEEEWDPPKGYIPDTDNPWIVEKKMAGWKEICE